MRKLSFSIGIIILFSCTAKKDNSKKTSSNEIEKTKLENNNSENLSEIEVPMVIYRVNGNYNNHIPVGFDEEKNKITSYPAPSDVVVDGNYKKPIELGNNWFLDQIGVSFNSKFLAVPYEEYAEFEEVNLEEMKARMILNSEFYDFYECASNLDVEEIKKAFSNEIDWKYLNENCKLKYSKSTPKDK